MRTRVTGAGEAAEGARFCLMFPRESVSVPVMRRVLGDTLRQLGIDDDTVGDMLLAVTEACTNVLQHSGQGSRYEVVARISRAECTVEVVDTGSGFRRRRPVRRRTVRPAGPRGRLAWARRPPAEPAVADLAESGRGLAIMEACVDDVRLRTGRGRGTVVSLSKQISWHAGQAVPAPEQLRDAG
jgi:serine/threonine-protein kinase RsbW